jgi:hypothetical protein
MEHLSGIEAFKAYCKDAGITFTPEGVKAAEDILLILFSFGDAEQAHLVHVDGKWNQIRAGVLHALEVLDLVRTRDIVPGVKRSEITEEGTKLVDAWRLFPDE